MHASDTPRTCPSGGSWPFLLGLDFQSSNRAAMTYNSATFRKVIMSGRPYLIGFVFVIATLLAVEAQNPLAWNAKAAKAARKKVKQAKEEDNP